MNKIFILNFFLFPNFSNIFNGGNRKKKDALHNDMGDDKNDENGIYPIHKDRVKICGKN